MEKESQKSINDSQNEKELPFLPMGSIVNARLEFKHIETGESIQSRPRPVLVLRDYGDGAVKIATLTSRIEKKHVQEYGHLLEKSEESVLRKALR